MVASTALLADRDIVTAAAVAVVMAIAAGVATAVAAGHVGVMSGSGVGQRAARQLAVQSAATTSRPPRSSRLITYNTRARQGSGTIFRLQLMIT